MIEKTVTAEISDYFSKQTYSSKRDLVWTTQAQIDSILKDSGFVYVSDTGSVIHTQKYCGSSCKYLVHIEQAVKHGYTKLCKQCTVGRHMEYVLTQFLETE